MKYFLDEKIGAKRQKTFCKKILAKSLPQIFDENLM